MSTDFYSKADDFDVWISPPAGFSVLFDNGQRGVAYDFTIKDGMFTDTTATTPVAERGDVIAYVEDQSGNGIPVTSGIAGSRPFWELYPKDNIMGMLGNGSGSMANTPPSSLMRNSDAVTLMLTGFLSSMSTSPGDMLALQATTSAGLEKFIQINPAGVQVRRIPGEAMAASQKVFDRDERFLLTVRIDFVKGKMEIRKNGRQFQEVPLTSSGMTATPSTSLSLMGDLGRVAYARGFIHGLIFIEEWMSDDMVFDYEDKLKADSLMQIR